MSLDRRRCAFVDEVGSQCRERKFPPLSDRHSAANADFCMTHWPDHPRDRDPACWSWPLPGVRDDDPWNVLADWHDGRCGCCGSPGGDVLDHDHQTGLVRGWLCRSCNVREGRSARPTSREARWRACPSVAMLDLLLPYRGRDFVCGDITIWPGMTFYPDGAPAAGRWPHAVTCALSSEWTSGWPGVAWRCEHDHLGALRRSLSEPMSDGEELLLYVPDAEARAARPGSFAARSLGALLDEGESA